MVGVMAVGACGGDDDSGGALSTIIVQDQDGVGGSVIGWFYDHDIHVLPAPPEGSCRVDDTSAPTCDPACSGGQVCALDHTCIDPVMMIDVGTLTIEGTDAGEISLTAGVNGWYELHQQQTLLANARHVVVSATGSDQMGAFEVGLDAPTDNFLLNGEPSPPVEGEDLALAWGGADPDSVVRVRLLDSAGKAGIWCEVADTGSFAIPAQVVSDFLAIAEWNDAGAGSTVERYRETVISVDGGARVQLHLGRGALFFLAPPG
jgi:hypothetical protein